MPCAHFSSVPVCVYCSSVLYPRYLYTHCSSTVNLCSLYFCAHCSLLPTVPLCLLFLYFHCSSVSTISLCPLLLSVPFYTVPLCLCAHNRLGAPDPCAYLCLLFLCHVLFPQSFSEHSTKAQMHIGTNKRFKEVFLSATRV